MLLLLKSPSFRKSVAVAVVQLALQQLGLLLRLLLRNSRTSQLTRLLSRIHSESHHHHSSSNSSSRCNKWMQITKSAAIWSDSSHQIPPRPRLLFRSRRCRKIRLLRWLWSSNSRTYRVCTLERVGVSTRAASDNACLRRRTFKLIYLRSQLVVQPQRVITIISSAQTSSQDKIGRPPLRWWIPSLISKAHSIGSRNRLRCNWRSPQGPYQLLPMDHPRLLRGRTDWR